MTTPRTYTTKEIQALFGFKYRKNVHELAQRWPAAFVIVHHGKLSPKHQPDPTTWDAEKIDEFIRWRNSGKEFKNVGPDV